MEYFWFYFIGWGLCRLATRSVDKGHYGFDPEDAWGFRVGSWVPLFNYAGFLFGWLMMVGFFYINYYEQK